MHACALTAGSLQKTVFHFLVFSTSVPSSTDHHAALKSMLYRSAECTMLLLRRSYNNNQATGKPRKRHSSAECTMLLGRRTITKQQAKLTKGNTF